MLGILKPFMDKSSKGAPLSVTVSEPGSRSIVLSGSSVDVSRAVAVVTQIDVKPMQVLVEAVIAEVSHDFVRNLGATWKIGNSSAGSVFSLALSSVSGLSPGLTGLDFLLEGLQQDTASKVISTPSLVIQNNKQGALIFGKNVPVISSTTVSSAQSDPVQSYERVDVGHSLKIVPHVASNGEVLLSVDQEISSLSGDVTEAKDIVIDKRKITTNVLVRSGQLLALGGLNEDARVRTVDGVPYLASVPLLSVLFDANGRTDTTRSVVVFLRTVVLGTDLTDLVKHKSSLLTGVERPLLYKEVAAAKREEPPTKRVAAAPIPFQH